MANARMTEISPEGIEVYQNDINLYCNEYLENILHIDSDNIQPDNYKEISASFPDMLLYIRDRITPPPHDDIELMDKVFDVYVRLCLRMRQLPTVGMYGTLVRTAPSTFSDWNNQEYRNNDERYSKSVKRWKEVCKQYLINSLQNSSGGSINRIFIAKACFGLVETSPAPVQEIVSGITTTAQEIAERHRAAAELPIPEEPED